MPKYNLDALGDEEFEHVCQSLVQQIIGPGAKVYGMGKDGAREATFEGKAPYPSKEQQWEGKWIFQAKFHNTSRIGPRDARRTIIAEIDDELTKITKKYRHPCDNFILMTNVALTPAFQKGTRDVLDQKIIPKYNSRIKNIHVWGADEICCFLDAHPGIRRTYAGLLVTGDIVSYLLGVIEQGKERLDEIVKLYCQGCFDHERHAVLDDAGDVEDKPIPLDNVFVDLTVTLPDFPQQPSKLESLPAWLSQVAGDRERKSAMSYLLDDILHGIILIGSPGQGKSTLGQFLAQIHRARLLGREQEFKKYGADLEKCIPRIPFRITLRDYAQWIIGQKQQSRPDGMSSYIATLMSTDADRNVTAEDVQSILKSNPSVLILDGLDEVAEKELRKRMLDNITSFVNQIRDVLGGNLRVIASTRPYGYSEEFEPSRYLHLTLEHLSPDIATLYAERWVNERQLHQTEGDRIISAFRACQADSTIRVLTGTPLQVTILLVIIRARGTPPKQREELFERYMDIIYQREQRKQLELLQTSQNLIYGLHKYLAYLLHRRAERDETGARLSLKEFENVVKDYLLRDPMLSERELEDATQRIIKEASERLVLIVGLREGVIGFELPSVREFFAAAHLVDTARGSRERDLRFKAICRSPHWRNVALFFAGRVGRRLPGEAASLIDVCREIDTERVDRLLKRGAALAMQIADERAMREVHNEIGAIQYGLTRLEANLHDSEEFAKILKAFPKRYLDRVVFPELDNKLAKLPVEELSLYGDLYQTLFGKTPTLYQCVKTAAYHSDPEVSLWALGQAIQSEIAEKWVVDLLESVANTLLLPGTEGTISLHPAHFTIFLDFNLPASSREILEKAAIFWSLTKGGRWGDFSRLPQILMDRIAAQPNIQDQNILCLALQALDLVFSLSGSGSLQMGLLNPDARGVIRASQILLDTWDKIPAQRKNSLEIRVFALLVFWCDPEDQNGQRQLMDCVKKSPGYFDILQLISWGLPLAWDTEEDEITDASLREFATFSKHYQTTDQFGGDIRELNLLLERQSKKVMNHPQKLNLWILSNFDKTIEEHLDDKILRQIHAWFTRRKATEKVLRFMPRGVIIRPPENDVDYSELVITLAEKKFSTSQRMTELQGLLFYELDKPLVAREFKLRQRIRNLAEKVLELSVTSGPEIESWLAHLYWLGVSENILEDRDLFQIARRLRGASGFPTHHRWHREEGGEFAQGRVLKLLKCSDEDVSATAAVSLITFHKELADPDAGEILWKLAGNPNDPWQPRYLDAMSFCSLRWNTWQATWLEALKGNVSEALLKSWADVIRRGGCAESTDGKALLEFLLTV
jgi:hypothetical protein